MRAKQSRIGKMYWKLGSPYASPNFIEVSMNLSHLQITPYIEVNETIGFVADRICKSLGDSLLGLYLFGSLTYDDFNQDRSDIDLIAILKKPATPTEIEDLRETLTLLMERYPKWGNRVEVSYTPKEMFEKADPPGKRPYFGDGRFWPDALYGDEWIINNYLLYKYGISLIGPDVKALFKEPTIEHVKEASIEGYYKELEPILRNKDWMTTAAINLTLSSISVGYCLPS